ncbi:SDR family oxidoreductase [Vibrio cholerae]|uniref:SDR family oxidoreductase n=1 Tax=Vibrio cholerae TaxID=666 RepID=UPI001D652447|nr:SDR family oxidoreductase [Vibrio cholerae]EGR3968951.1 SDR family oxidoreductase [Vibrio cholerae]EKF9563345.1 SDR family oxidoreductase [Vibrio cholerae]MCX9474323.1 SDR family oxidoreductase [Vibrio cholerae]MCX9479475.1 SDR family oxidoreductase [Vibrio cholerae]
MKESILITGCSSGIGYYCAKELHKAGYRVIASCRKPEDVSRLNSEGIFCLQLDVTDTDSIQSAISETIEHTGGTLDVLFNNAAYGQCGALEDLPTDALRAQFETNLFGWHELTKAVIPIMLEQGGGKIIQNSSVLGLVAMKYRGAYNASKFALEGYTDTLRLELMDTKISVSLIEPGPIVSKFRENALRAFESVIDKDRSRHHNSYQSTIERLGKESPSSKFTLPPDSVLKRVERILEDPSPKARYYVTQPTYIFGFLRRILPVSMLDKLLAKSD